MKTKVFLTLVLIILTSTATMAQEKENRFEIELNGDVVFISTELSGASLNAGLGFETILQYRFRPFTSIYGGWGWNHSNAEESFAGTDVDFEETGYIFGLQYKHQFVESPVSYFVRGGVLYNHIETENSNGYIINDSGHGFGYQLVGGIEVSIANNWSLVSGLKFSSLSREIEFEGENYQLDHCYVSVRLGIIKSF